MKTGDRFWMIRHPGKDTEHGTPYRVVWDEAEVAEIKKHWFEGFNPPKEILHGTGD